MSVAVNSRPVLQPVKTNLINGNPNLSYEIVQPKASKINWEDHKIQQMLATYQMFERRSDHKIFTVTKSDGGKSSDIVFFSSEIINEKIRYEGDASPFDKALAKCFRMAEHELFKHIPVDPGKIIRATREAGWMQHPPYLASWTDDGHVYIGSDDFIPKGIKAAMGILYPNGHMSITDGNFWYYLGSMAKEFTLKDVDFTCFGNDMVKFEKFLQAISTGAGKEMLLLSSLKCRFTQLQAEVVKALADYSVAAALRKQLLETELKSLKEKVVAEDVKLVAEQLVKIKKVLANMNSRKETLSAQGLKELATLEERHETLKRYIYVVKQLEGHTRFVADLGSREQYLQVAEELEKPVYNKDRTSDNTGGYRTALLYYQEALKFRIDAEAYRKMGALKIFLSDDDGAIRDTLVAFQLNPRDVRVAINLALAHLRQQKLEEAKKWSLAALAIDDKNYKANTIYADALSRYYAKSKDESLPAIAFIHLNKALELAPDEKSKQYTLRLIEALKKACA